MIKPARFFSLHWNNEKRKIIQMVTMNNEVITSRKNPRIQRIKKLLSSSSYRQSEKAFIIEGVRLVEEAITSGWVIQELYISDDLSERGKSFLANKAVPDCTGYQVSDNVMADLTDTETPQGITAVLLQHEMALPERPDYLLVLDAVRDPGNVGTILRTASAAGVNVVLIAPETADPFSPKVLRAGMGAQLKFPVSQCSWEKIASIIHAHEGMKTLLADTGDGTSLWEEDFTKAIALIVSNEASGPSPSARDLADHIITIPMPGSCESLNAAIAASLLMYEVVRQRR
jgi:TrmH family RNA methyltransferase